VSRQGAVGANVLIIDDTSEARELSAACLEFRGFCTQAAEDGPSGLAMALAQSPDVILLDFCMPNMDGAEVVRHLKSDERTREIPIVMLTAIPEAVPASTRENLAAFIEKPCGAERLANTVLDALIAPPARSA
jgi:CheY-like chemotaxis protein